MNDEAFHAKLAELGRINAAKRELVDKPCVVCGTVMQQVFKKRQYCSESCRHKALRTTWGGRQKPKETVDAG